MPKIQASSQFIVNCFNPEQSLNSDNINMPRVGSVANAWTDVNTPERTKKVPNKESAKAINDNNTVQLFNASRLSVTAKE